MCVRGGGSFDSPETPQSNEKVLCYNESAYRLGARRLTLQEDQVLNQRDVGYGQKIQLCMQF